MSPPRTNQPNPLPPLSSAIATSFYRANKRLTSHPHAVHGRAHAPAESGQAAAAGPESDVHTGRDVVHVLDGLSHLGKCLSHLFVGGVEQLLHGAERAS